MRNFKFLFTSLMLVLILAGCDSNLMEEIKSDPIVEASELDTLNNELGLVLSSLDDLSQLRNISIKKSGEIILEEYFNYTNENTLNNVFSDTKSITSLLVGIAVDEGYIDSLEQSIGDYIDLSEYDNKEQLEAIKLKHLLTMSAGLIWNSNDLSSEFNNLKYSTDPLDLILTREMVFTPGSEFNYSDGSSHMMSIIFTKATGMNLQDFAEEKLFGPMGIENVVWNDDIDGNNFGGCDLFLRSKDMIKIGELILSKGMYQNSRIVSESWIEQSTSPQIKTNNSDSDSNQYGYYWWLGNKNGLDIIAAFGHGGQFIYIIPKLELIITASCIVTANDDLAYESFSQVQNTILNQLIPLFDK